MNDNNEYRILNISYYIELQIGSIMIENDPHEK